MKSQARSDFPVFLYEIIVLGFTNPLDAHYSGFTRPLVEKIIIWSKDMNHLVQEMTHLNEKHLATTTPRVGACQDCSEFSSFLRFLRFPDCLFEAR